MRPVCVSRCPVAAPVFLRSVPEPGLVTKAGDRARCLVWAQHGLVARILSGSLSIWPQCLRDMVANATCCGPCVLGWAQGVSLYDAENALLFLDVKAEALGGVTVPLFAAGRAQSNLGLTDSRTRVLVTGPCRVASLPGSSCRTWRPTAPGLEPKPLVGGRGHPDLASLLPRLHHTPDKREWVAVGLLWEIVWL